MDSNQWGRRNYIAHDQGNRLFKSPVVGRTHVPSETINPEFSPTSWEIGRCHLLHCVFAHLFIIAAAADLYGR